MAAGVYDSLCGLSGCGNPGQDACGGRERGEAFRGADRDPGRYHEAGRHERPRGQERTSELGERF